MTSDFRVVVARTGDRHAHATLRGVGKDRPFKVDKHGNLSNAENLYEDNAFTGPRLIYLA